MNSVIPLEQCALFGHVKWIRKTFNSKNTCACFVRLIKEKMKQEGRRGCVGNGLKAS